MNSTTYPPSEFGGYAPRLLDVLPDGFRVYAIAGSEGGGYSTEGDLVRTSIDNADLNDMFREFLDVLNIVNGQRSTLTNHLCFRTDRSADAVAQVLGDDDFEISSEFGIPQSMRSRPEVLTVGYSFTDFDKRTSYTWKFLRDATRVELEALHARAVAADNKLTTTAILRRLLDPTPGINSDGRNVYGLYSGDDFLPPRHGFRTFADPHNHYLTTNSADPDGTDLDDMIRHVTEHGYGRTPGSQLLLFCNPEDAGPLTTIRAATGGAAHDYLPSAGAPAYLTDKEIVGDIAPADFNALKITGSYGPAWITEHEMMPPGYFVLVASSGPGSDLNPVGFREHPNPAHRGLRLLPGARDAYPLVDSYYTRGFGVGVRHRGAAVAMQITTSALYTPPAL